MKMTPLLFVKLWLKLSFSSAMWCSWFFVLFYVLILLSNIQDENFTIDKLVKQVLVMVVLALFMGLFGSIYGLNHYYKCQRVERETKERMNRCRQDPPTSPES
jgi:hypothetical protein